MENLQSYFNKRAQLQSGQDRYASSASRQAAEERILARQVLEGETVIATNRKPIPAGDYAIVEVDEDGITIIASQKSFFESVYELDLPL